MKSKKKLLGRLLGIVLLLILGVVLYRLNDIEFAELSNETGRSFEKAIVKELVKDNLQEDGTRSGTQYIKLEIRSGKYSGQVLEATSSNNYLYGADCTVGLKVIAIINEYDGSINVSVYNYDRGSWLYGIILFFFAVLWLIGGRKGLNSVIGLIFTFVFIIFMFLPMIYRGVSPVSAAVVVVVLTTIVVMFLMNGITVKSVCAVVGTVAGVIMSALFALAFGKVTHITGYNVSDIEILMYIGQMTKMKIGDLMFAGILISSLGAVMDVALSIASTVCEIHSKNETLSLKELYLSGLNVGKDMMGTMSNTLILAFTGGSINTLVYIYSYRYPYYQNLNMYSVGIELIQGISATLGVILTVPVVAFMTAWVIKRR